MTSAGKPAPQNCPNNSRREHRPAHAKSKAPDRPADRDTTHGGVARYAELHRDGGIAHGSGHERLLRHIFVRLPKNALLDGTILTSPGRDLADAAETQINAVPGIGVETQVNRPLERSSRRKGQRSELKIGLAKTFPPDAGPYRRNRQNDANDAEYKREKEHRIGGPPEFRYGCGRDRECNPIRKDGRRPKADSGVAVFAFRPASRPVLPPQPWRFRIGLLGCRLLLYFAGPVNDRVNDRDADQNEDRRDHRSRPAIPRDLAGRTE